MTLPVMKAPSGRMRSALNSSNLIWSACASSRRYLKHAPTAWAVEPLQLVIGEWCDDDVGADGVALGTALSPTDSHPFQWKNTLSWHLGPDAKVRILRFKNLPRFRHDRGLQNHV